MPALLSFANTMRAVFLRLVARWLVTMLVVGLGGCGHAPKPEAAAKIEFTQVPERNPGNQNKQDVMEGTVTGAKPGQRLVLYSKSGGLWWLQPLLTSPFTPILGNGVWRNETHLGTSYAVLLVDAGYRPAAVLDRLPEHEPGVAAVGVSEGQEKPSSHFIDFSGFTWRVRMKPSDRGGTSNPYDPENVSVDEAGRLHLRIVKKNDKWSCSELNLTQSLGYGTYAFTVEDTSKLDAAAVFGMFTWDYSTDQQNHREFDLNISRWGDPQNENAEYEIQPSLVPVNFSRFTAPAGKLKHTIIWEPGRITMTTTRVSETSGNLNGEGAVVAKHVFTSEVPTAGFESVRMVFFAYRKPNQKVTSLKQDAEVVVDRFEYFP